MKKAQTSNGRGAGLVIFVLVVLIGLVILGVKVFSPEAPAIRLTNPVKALGKSTELRVEVSDPRHRIKAVSIRVEQKGKAFKLPVAVAVAHPPGPPWWKFWASRPVSRWTVTARAGQQELPALHQGHARIVITAVNNSWGRFFRGGRSVMVLRLPVRFSPPQIYVLTTQNNVTDGGCRCSSRRSCRRSAGLAGAARWAGPWLGGQQDR